MEEHEVKTVLLPESAKFKNVQVDYEAVYSYCGLTEELYMNEEQMRENDLTMKNRYRETQGLLTSKEIVAVRKKYRISQSDFCLLLGWGGKTIARYEGHQVQDKAHDTILKKIDKDPEWFLNLLEEARENLSAESYQKYFRIATALYEGEQDLYLRKSIEARYAPFQGNQMVHGNANLSLDKAIDVIRYFAASAKVTSLYKVKLMKLMWYADALSYKKRGHAMTGLVYQALKMGAVPIGHEAVIGLKGVPCEEVELGEISAYHFTLTEETGYPFLSDGDKEILETVIDRLGKMTKDEIVEFMHGETAYKETASRAIIQFKYAEDLQI